MNESRPEGLHPMANRAETFMPKEFVIPVYYYAALLESHAQLQRQIVEMDKLSAADSETIMRLEAERDAALVDARRYRIGKGDWLMYCNDCSQLIEHCRCSYFGGRIDPIREKRERDFWIGKQKESTAIDAAAPTTEGEKNG